MTKPSASYGVSLGVGKLHKVLVARRAWPTKRLTPTIATTVVRRRVWVQTRGAITSTSWTVRDRDVEVIELHDLLAQTMQQRGQGLAARRKIVANEVGLGWCRTRATSWTR